MIFGYRFSTTKINKFRCYTIIYLIQELFSRSNKWYRQETLIYLYLYYQSDEMGTLRVSFPQPL